MADNILLLVISESTIFNTETTCRNGIQGNVDVTGKPKSPSKSAGKDKTHDSGC